MSLSQFFETGTVVATRQIHEKMQKSGYFTAEIYIALKRYCVKNWGDCGEEFKEINDYAIKKGNERIMGTYETIFGEIWIVTEGPADDRVTTVLFPGDN